MRKYFIFSLLSVMMLCTQQIMATGNGDPKTKKTTPTRNGTTHAVLYPTRDGAKKVDNGETAQKQSTPTRNGTTEVVLRPNRDGAKQNNTQENQVNNHRCHQVLANCEESNSSLRKELYKAKRELAALRKGGARKEVEVLKRELQAAKAELVSSKNRISRLEKNLEISRNKKQAAQQDLEECKDYTSYLNHKIDKYEANKQPRNNKGRVKNKFYPQQKAHKNGYASHEQRYENYKAEQNCD